MTSQTTLRQQLRIDLQDEVVASERWSDDTLNRHLEAALNELSLHAPLEKKTALTTVSNSRDIDVSSLTPRMRIVAVEHPTGEYPPSYAPYTLWADTLTLDIVTEPTGAEAVNVFWEGVHTLIPTPTFDPVMDELLIIGAAAFAAIEWASKASNQLNTGGDETWGRYMDFGTEKLTLFRKKLAALPQVSRVRTSRIFTPTPSILRSQDTDPGP